MKFKMFLAALVAFVSINPNTTSATKTEVPTAKEIVAAQADCKRKWGKSLAAAQCLLGIDITVIERRVIASESKLADKLADLHSKMVQIEQRLRAAKRDAKAPVPTPTKRVDKAPPVRTVQPRVVPTAPVVVQPSHRVVELPGRYAAATWLMPGMGTHIEVRGLANGANRWVGREMVRVRAVVLKNGAPLAIAQPGLPGQPTFEQVYADLDGDGQPEPRPYFVVNPRLVDTLYVGCRSGEQQLRIVYLVESGQAVAAPGIPPQPLWRAHQRVRYPFNGISPRSWIVAGGGWRD